MKRYRVFFLNSDLENFPDSVIVEEMYTAFAVVTCEEEAIVEIAEGSDKLIAR